MKSTHARFWYYLYRK